jgi:hypoxanthine phosphoribosyltransferase
MSGLAILERNAILDLNRAQFDHVCAELMAIVSRDRRPDGLIGIPTGGMVVAQSMARAAGRDMPVLALTCRRPSSKMKPGASAVRKIVGGLPRPIVDRLRFAEHALLTRRRPSPPSAPYRFNEQELDGIDRWIESVRQPLSLLIVDDAVDSGATLYQVMDAVRRRTPEDTEVRSAVITVTTDQPLVQPDYSMFHRQLCRFPWSLDAR